MKHYSRTCTCIFYLVEEQFTQNIKIPHFFFLILMKHYSSTGKD